jgi:hypothetical protein
LIAIAGSAWSGFFEDKLKVGFLAWGLVGLVIAIPELFAAAVSRSPWPTISGTVGHLESRWAFVAVIVVAVIVALAARVAALIIPLLGSTASPEDPSPTAESVAAEAVKRELRRANGTAAAQAGGWRRRFVFAYFPSSIVVVALAGYIASQTSTNRWILGYVIYGLIAVFGILIPSILTRVENVPNPPFTSIFVTISALFTYQRWIATIVVIGLVILLIHLALYPWPDVFHQNPAPDSP